MLMDMLAGWHANMPVQLMVSLGALYRNTVIMALKVTDPLFLSLVDREPAH